MNAKKNAVPQRKVSKGKGTKRAGTQRAKGAKRGGPRLHIFGQPVAPVVKFLLKGGAKPMGIKAALRSNGCQVGAVRHLIARVKETLKDTPDATLSAAQKARLTRAAKTE